MSLDCLPWEVLLNIIPRLSNAALRQMMLVNCSLNFYARRQFYQSSRIIFRGTARLRNFANFIRNNPTTPLRDFPFSRFENYTTETNRDDILTVLINMRNLETLDFHQLNIRRVLSNFATFTDADEQNLPPPNRVTKIIVNPMPRQAEDQYVSLVFLFAYRTTLERVVLPVVDAALTG